MFMKTTQKKTIIKDPISLGSNKKCAEVIHVRSPYSFWVRLDDYKNDYRAMLAQLQLDYADSKDTENEYKN